MARPRRVPVQTEAEITRDAIAELQAHMATITAALQALTVQRPIQPVLADGEQRHEEDDEEDEAEVADNVNPFAPLRNNRALAHNNEQGMPDNFQWEKRFKTEIPEFHGNTSAEELLDWIVTVEEILEFRRVPMDRCVPVLTMRFRSRAAAWWTILDVNMMSY